MRLLSIAETLYVYMCKTHSHTYITDDCNNVYDTASISTHSLHDTFMQIPFHMDACNISFQINNFLAFQIVLLSRTTGPFLAARFGPAGPKLGADRQPGITPELTAFGRINCK